MISFFYLLLCAALSLGYNTNTLRPGVKFPELETIQILNAIKLCIARTGISRDVVILMRAGHYREDRQFKEFIYCAYKESGYATDDGRVLVDKVSTLFPIAVQIKDVLKKCNEECGSDAPDTTYKFFSCFQDSSPVRLQLS